MLEGRVASNKSNIVNLHIQLFDQLAGQAKLETVFPVKQGQSGRNQWEAALSPRETPASDINLVLAAQQRAPSTYRLTSSFFEASGTSQSGTSSAGMFSSR